VTSDAQTKGRRLMAAVRDLQPVLRASVRATDEGGHVPADVIAALRSAGAYRMVVPAALGGDEIDLAGFLGVLEAVSEGNPAAGWDLAASSWATFIALTLPVVGGERIFANGADVAFAGGFNGAGTAVPADGSFAVSGRWHFHSGSAEADWFLFGGLEVPGSEALSGGTSPQIFAFAPRAETTIHPTWDVAGLRGTGSNDTSLAGVLVPLALTQVRAAPSPWPGPLFRISPYTLINALHFSAVATGIARQAIDALVELAGRKTPSRTASLLRERVQTQESVARAEFLLESARAFRRAVVAEVWAAAMAETAIDDSLTARVRLAGVGATENAVRAVDMMFSLAGATAIDNANPISHCFRDIHAVAQNANVHVTHFENIGRNLLGLAPIPRL
jgi:alkylation response protein AidB-like acyl-CoA dehydrogenase